jgi:hypothetical protein
VTPRFTIRPATLQPPCLGREPKARVATVSGLLIRQMNSQAVNIGVHAVQVKGKKSMASFAGTDISPIEVILTSSQAAGTLFP